MAKRKQHDRGLSSSEEEADDEFEVEAIVGKKSDRRTGTKYLVKWKGWSDPTWEPQANLTGHCSALIDAFEKSTPNMASVKAATSAAATQQPTRASKRKASTEKAVSLARTSTSGLPKVLAPAPSSTIPSKTTNPTSLPSETLLTPELTPTSQPSTSQSGCIEKAAQKAVSAPVPAASASSTPSHPQQPRSKPTNSRAPPKPQSPHRNILSSAQLSGDQPTSNAAHYSPPQRRRISAQKRPAVGHVPDDDFSEEEEEFEPDDEYSSDSDVQTSRPCVMTHNPQVVLRKNNTPQVSTNPEQQPSTPTQGPVRRTASSTPIHDAYINKLVAYCPLSELWMQEKKTGRPKKEYRCVGSAFIVGRVCAFTVRKATYEIRWLDTLFNNNAESVDLNTIKRGQINYYELQKNKGAPRWAELVRPDPANDLCLGVDLGDLEEASLFEQSGARPVNIREVETIKSMNFEPDQTMAAPGDLFTHPDGSTDTRVKPGYQHLFEHSASSSFFAYIPVYYWRQVLQETNDHAFHLKIPQFSLDELMTFLGILFYMALVDKGEMANYWAEQPESAIFGQVDYGLDNTMPFKRFKSLRRAFCFRCPRSLSQEELRADAAVRIRPLLNLIKANSTKYLEVGRDIAVDEASVAYRSKFGRHLIMYNPTKPGGKYHFRFYMACCSTSWVSLNFRLHCASEMEHRLDGIESETVARALADDLKDSAKVRQHVLEVVLPFYNTKRVINCDNYYTSVQLLEALRVKGLYGRGTVRRTSKHFPRHVILSEPKKAAVAVSVPRGSSTSSAANRRVENTQTETHTPDIDDATTSNTQEVSAGNSDEVVRGSSRQGVSVEHQMLAASWCDGSIVTIVSNADSSQLTTVTRRIKTTKQDFPAPEAIKMYNQHMQGVDRHDQLRSRFSLADGHSFKKWYKKLGVAMIDIARVNAFCTRQLVVKSKKRDPHRQFVVTLVQELLNGTWKNAPSCDQSMLFGADSPGRPAQNASPLPRPSNARFTSPGSTSSSPSSLGCTAVNSQQVFTDNRKKRVCIVCRFEGRHPTQQTDFCTQHSVCLCKKVYPPCLFGCDEPEMTCWEKYHKVYLSTGLFSSRGNVNKSSVYYRNKVGVAQREQAQRDATTSGRAVCPPTRAARSISFESLDTVGEIVSSMEF